jgi:hypothetical protein
LLLIFLKEIALGTKFKIIDGQFHLYELFADLPFDFGNAGFKGIGSMLFKDLMPAALFQDLRVRGVLRRIYVIHHQRLTHRVRKIVHLI